MKNPAVKQLKEGIITNNPIFVQLLGMCPTLAVTTAIVNALGMGAAVTVVLVFSNLFISLVRNIVPKQIRIASYIVIISGFVTAVELIIKAFFPVINKALGLFIPLIVVNCIILARAEAFASKNKPLPSVIDGAATGIGFTLALTCVAFVRELLGTGKIFASAEGVGGLSIFGDKYPGASFFLLPAGAFLTLGCLIALVQKITAVSEERARKRAADAGALTEETDGDFADEAHADKKDTDAPAGKAEILDKYAFDAFEDEFGDADDYELDDAFEDEFDDELDDALDDAFEDEFGETLKIVFDDEPDDADHKNGEEEV